MFPRHLLCCLLTCLLWLNASAADSEALLAEPQTEAVSLGDRQRQRIEAADRALQAGLYGIAADLYQRLAEDKQLSEKEVEAARLGQLSALIGAGELEAATRLLAGLPGWDSPRWKLRRMLLALYGENPAYAGLLLEGLQAEDLPPSERAWYQLARGLLAESEQQYEQALQHFDKALEGAGSRDLREHFNTIKTRAHLLIGDRDEALLQDLEQRLEKEAGSSAGFNYAAQYAALLHRLERREEAMAFLAETLAQARSQKSDRLDSLQLLYGLIAGAGDERGRDQLASILRQGNDRLVQRQALSLLAASWRGGEQEAQTTLLQELIEPESEERHALLDALLLIRARQQLAAGALDEAVGDATRLLEELPGSERGAEARQLLARIALERDPPQYRLAADHFSQLREPLTGTARADYSARIADCYYLNGDFDRAADFYAQAVRDAPDSALSPRRQFLQVESLLRSRQHTTAREVLQGWKAQSAPARRWLWRAEWNFALHLQQHEGSQQAYDHLGQRLSQSSLADIPAETALRLKWFQAQLSLALDEIASTPAYIDAIFDLLEGLPERSLREGERKRIAANTYLLQGQVLMRLELESDAFEAFRILREEFPGSGPAAVSYLDEARYLQGAGRLAEAQQILVRFADAYPENAYVTQALFEAALSAEKRGINESYSEAVRLLERVIEGEGTSTLAFYARLRQADILRTQGEFAAAEQRYAALLEAHPEHPERFLAEMGIAYAIKARALRDNSVSEQAVAAFERLADLPDLPAALRLEAGYQLAQTLQTQQVGEAARLAYWQVIERFLPNDNESLPELGPGGRYWLARAMLELAGLHEQDGQLEESRRLYGLMVRHALPGAETARARLERENPSSGVR